MGRMKVLGRDRRNQRKAIGLRVFDGVYQGHDQDNHAVLLMFHPKA
jgi:hypothetical protein